MTGGAKGAGASCGAAPSCAVGAGWIGNNESNANYDGNRCAARGDDHVGAGDRNLAGDLSRAVRLDFDGWDVR